MTSFKNDNTRVTAPMFDTNMRYGIETFMSLSIVFHDQFSIVYNVFYLLYKNASNKRNILP